MSSPSPETRPWHAAAVMGAFAIVYVVWGSTYLAIRMGVQTMPPLVLGGVRFLLSGPLMIAVGLLLGGRFWTSRRDTGRIIVQGTFLLAGGNGFVSWGEQWVPSNLAALLVASTALWMALLGSLGPKGDRVSVWSGFGLLLGFAGVAVLVTSGAVGGGVSLKGCGLLLIAALSWAVGSVYTRRFPVQASPAIVAGGQMLTAGVLMSAIALLDGEFSRWNPDNLHSWYVISYLVVFGSCVGFSAFSWLVHQVTPARLGTYAYVNPAVAVLLGGWLLNERLSAWQLVGTLVILSGVVIVTVTGASRRK